MRRVHLLTTGKCERAALHESLARLFPESGVEFVPTKGLTTSFTSGFIGDAPPIGLRTTAEKFAGELVATMDEAGRDDLVVGVDDLELENVGRPGAVVALLRQSLQSTLMRYPGSAQKKERLEEALRTRGSFHLLVPMVEAYFFGEPAALQRAGARRASKFDPDAIDVEAFAVNDEDFLRAPDADHPNPERRKQSWAKPERHRHPKLYLKFLCDPEDPYGRTYRESHEGVAALRSLAWHQVLSPPAHARFARSLVTDLADALGVASPVADAVASAPWPRPRDVVLRNV